MSLHLSLLLAAAVQLSDGGDPERQMQPNDNVRAPAAPVYDGSASQLDVSAPQADAADIRIDGRLDEKAWSRAAVLHGFTQFEPVEGVAASEETEVLLLITDDALLFGVRAFDRNGTAGVRATLSERDKFGRSDDYVRLILDTFNDQRRAYVFTVNPLGVQGDGLWVEGSGGRSPIDSNPDFVWESAGQLHERGYTTEIKIPFKSVRFPETSVQDWGLQIERRIQRTGFEQSWAPISRDGANRLAQAGKLSGLRDLDPGLFLEINPEVTGSKQGSFNSDVGALTRTPASGDFGLNVRYGLTSNLTLDGTYNPDFSQIEADAGQIAVNERFALFFPEQRPFFLEGTDVFQMPRQLIYTRSIGNPVGAAKVSGKVGSFNVAYLGAVDQVSSTGDNPIVNLMRVKRDVGESSSLGLAYTDRTLAGNDYNRVVGADGRFVIARRYTVNLMAAGSATGRPDEARQWGSLFLAQVNRSGQRFTFNASFEDVNDDFRAGSGFIRRVDNTQVQGRTSYTWRGGRGAFVESVGSWVDFEGFWNREDFWNGQRALETQAEVGVRASLRNNFTTFLTYSRSSFNYGADEYSGLFASNGQGDRVALAPEVETFGGLNSLRVRGWFSGFERVRGSFGAGWSETPLFDRSLGVPVDLANSLSGDVGFTFYPTRALSAELGLRHVSLFRKLDGSRYSSATIPRIRGQYQFSRALFIRAIGEYSSQERGDLLDPSTGQAVEFCSDDGCSVRSGSDRHDFRLEGLLGYEPTPGTVVFLGYTRQMRDTAGFRFRQVQTQADGLFFKLSYRFRM